MLLAILIILAVLISAGIWVAVVLLSWPIWIGIVVTNVSVLALVAFVVIRKVLIASRAAALEQELLKQAAEQANKANPQRRAEILALQEKMKAAIATLKKSKFGARGGKAALSALPWYVIVGPPAAGKTTALEQSGLAWSNPGGGSKIRGTGGTKNCEWWFSQEAILLDTAGRFSTEDDDQEEWFAFLDTLKRFRKQRPLDGIIIAVAVAGAAGTPDLITAKDDQLEELAEKLRARVDEVITRLEMVVPIYVMFTKADLIAGFVEFWGDLGKQQRGQPWGSTFSLDDERLSEPARACEAEFDLLVSTLHARIIERLPQERSPEGRSRILQFPIEFKSLKAPVAHFIEELCKPNPYQESPILRGFYFTSGTQVGRPLDRVLAGMARGFGLPPMHERAGATQPVSYFVTDLFRSVIFPDRHLAVRSSARVRRSTVRQMVVGGLALLITLLFVLPAIISYAGNLDLVRATAHDIEQVKQAEKAAGRAAAPNADSLELLLDRVQALEQANEKTKIIGLYGPRVAPDLYEPLRTFYIQRLRATVEGPVREQIKGDLRSIADNTRNDAEIFQSSYDNLKLFLMMTVPEHLDPDWATQKLADKWAKALRRDDNTDAERLKAHARYYIQALAADRSWAWPSEEAMVARARSRLSRQPLDELQYGWLVGTAEGVPAIKPDKIIYGPSSQYIIPRGSDVMVPGAYTLAGWQKIHAALESETGHLTLEPWVVGTPIVTDDGAAVGADRLRDKYFQHYEAAWSSFLEGFNVQVPKDLPTAVDELKAISEREGPYTRLFRTLSENVALDTSPTTLTGKLLAKGKEAAQQAAQGAVDKVTGNDAGPADRPISPVERRFRPLVRFAFGDPATKGEAPTRLSQYLDQVNNLAISLNRLDQSRAEPTAEFQTELAKASALVEGMIGDLDSRSRILLEPFLMNPIRGSRAGVISSGGTALGDKWKAEVWEIWMSKLAKRFPFADVAEEAALAEFADFFRPQTGTLWKFYEKSLSDKLERNGNGFSPRPSADPIPFRADFLQCLGRAQEVTEAVFGTAPEPAVSFQLKLESVGPNIAEVTFRVDGKETVYRNGPERWVATQWPNAGTPKGASLLVKGAGFQDEIPRNGDFGIFRLLAIGNIKSVGAEGILAATWSLNRPGEPPVTIQFKPGKSTHPFNRDFFKRLACPAEVTMPTTPANALFPR